MNEKALSLMTGALMGDGYLTKRDKYFCWQHSMAQEEYALHKAKRFAEVSGLSYTVYYVNKEYPAIRVVFKLGDQHSYYRNVFYPNGDKTVGRRELNWLDAEGLSWWYQDDGSLSVYKSKHRNSTQRSAKLCTHSFSFEENEIIRNYLFVVWGVETRTRQEKQKYWFQWLGAKSLNVLFTKICSSVPSMGYKFDLKYVLRYKEAENLL